MKYVDIKVAQKPELSPKKEKGSSFMRGLLFITILMIVVGIGLFFSKKTSIFNPINIVNTVAASNLKETDGRTNILILGSDQRTVGAVNSVLTDTLVVVSLGKLEGDVVLISLPRDLWVKNPLGGYGKINSLYADGGAENTSRVVGDVLGIPVHYYVVVDFNIFKESINVLDGIEVDVETAFEDFYYPIEGKESDTCGTPQAEIDKAMQEGNEVCPLNLCSCRYKHLKFEKGIQNMDGQTALEFARSRKGSNGENTDFARAKRQQKVILAVKNRALSLETLANPLKLKELYDTYAKNVDTNVGLNEIQSFYQLSQQVNFENIRSIVLDDRSSAEVGGLLYHPTDTTLYGGWVLIPRAGDFSQVHAYVQKYLFGGN